MNRSDVNLAKSPKVRYSTAYPTGREFGKKTRNAQNAAWGAVVRRRMRELRSGKVRGVPASAVFSRARNFLRSK